VAETGASRRISQQAVEAAVQAIAATSLSPRTDSMLRAFLGFSAIHRDGLQDDVSGASLKRVVEELFTVIPTPEGVSEKRFSGTLALRPKQGRPHWLRNDTYRGSFQDYVGPENRGREMFVDEDYRKPLLEDAVDQVVDSHNGDGDGWPARDALAAIALRNEALDPAMGWGEIVDLARERFGVTEEEWEKVTSAPQLGGDPFDGDPWDPDRLASTLSPPGTEKAKRSEQRVEELPEHLGRQVQRVLDALSDYGDRAIVALAGVPGTSKSYAARIAARIFASEGCLREIQFSPGYTYEEFIEGPRFGDGGEVEVLPGAFLELNERALLDPGHRYLLLIEELTRADVARVFGELLTYVEYRDENDLFATMYRRKERTRIAPNIAILATYNPSDRSAVNLDAALIRRMRVLDFPPSTALLAEILADNGLDPKVIEQLTAMFDACRELAGEERFEEAMPFGHAVFAAVEDEERDLHELWHEQLKRILVRPHTPRNEFYDTIVAHYPWISAGTSVVGDGQQTTLDGS
jgi:5-methylcytosine-specific restriction enzyme B